MVCDALPYSSDLAIGAFNNEFNRYQYLMTNVHSYYYNLLLKINPATLKKQ